MSPSDLRDVGGKEMLITWEDGHRSLYPYAYLRGCCPCAGCVDEWTGKRKVQPESVRADVKPDKMENVGRYAIRFDWTDGHRTGIYGFDYLRRICPCHQCSAAKGGAKRAES